MRTEPTEHEEQASLIRWAELRQAEWPELALLHAIPNGGDRHRVTAAKLKAEGVRPGVPDLCLPVPRGGWHGLYIELKTRTGRASKDQRRWIAALRRLGYRAEICRGWEAARVVIENYLSTEAVEPGAAAPAETQPPKQGAMQ